MEQNMPIDREFKKKLFAMMLKIRLAEEKVVEVYAKEQQMRTPTHLSIGQEAVATGVCLALRDDDQVFASHRCHAAYFAKGGDINAFFSELCGRENGSNAGRGGSAHLSAPEKNIHSSPILGGMVPVAVGAALAFQLNGTDQVAVGLAGDATYEEGVFAESLNFAVWKKLPVLFICENNLYSTNTHLRDRQPRSTICERVSMPELKAVSFDGNDVEVVYLKTVAAIKKIRQGRGPQFIEFLTYRYREHVGPNYDYDKGYRTKQEVDEWQEKCPVENYARKLVRAGVLKKEDVQELNKKYSAYADQAYQKALRSPWPLKEGLLENVC